MVVVFYSTCAWFRGGVDKEKVPLHTNKRAKSFCIVFIIDNFTVSGLNQNFKNHINGRGHMGRETTWALFKICH